MHNKSIPVIIGRCFFQLKIIFPILNITISLKLAIFPSNIKFLIFPIFNTRWLSVPVLYDFFSLSIFCSERSEYLIFFIYCYLYLYSAYHRPPLPIFVKFGCKPEKCKKNRKSQCQQSFAVIQQIVITEQDQNEHVLALFRNWTLLHELVHLYRFLFYEKK